MGSKTFNGVWFLCYSHDHAPAHVHGRYAGTEVILELLRDGKVRKADRRDAIVPSNAKRVEVRRILDTARQNSAALITLWENVHGPTS